MYATRTYFCMCTTHFMKHTSMKYMSQAINPQLEPCTKPRKGGPNLHNVMWDLAPKGLLQGEACLKRDIGLVYRGFTITFNFCSNNIQLLIMQGDLNVKLICSSNPFYMTKFSLTNSKCQTSL